MLANNRMKSKGLINTYSIDIVLCIDATASMGSIIELTKEKALAIYPSLEKEMAASQKNIETLRVKVITFRDYGVDSQAMVESPFFELPAQEDDLQSFVNGITVSGGGDGPENALEALSLALKSDWITKGSKRRHVVMVFTDNEALPLGERAGFPNYPAGMPKDLKQLASWWEKTDQNFFSNFDPAAGRLVVLAPDVYPWRNEEIGCWNRVILNPCEAGKGLSDTNFEEIISFLSASILKRDND